ncbi:hypothetical protein HA466_0017300 [Hirschfeldia incana]|nr:hypothetical protein HA466_0017300 [Hirschfeldia incana]
MLFYCALLYLPQISCENFCVDGESYERKNHHPRFFFLSLIVFELENLKRLPSHWCFCLFI